MPKIKNLSNDQLEDYKEAYLSMQSTDPDNNIYKRKIKCIEVALHQRDLINFDLPGATSQKTSLFKKLFSIFKKKN